MIASARRACPPLLLAAALGTGLIARPAGAGVTATWTVETYSQYDAGDAENAFTVSKLSAGGQSMAMKS